MSVDTDLYSKLVTVTSLPVQQNTISEDKAEPRIWFARSLENTDLLTSKAIMMTDSTYDVEVSGLDVDAVETKAAAIKSAMNGFQGTMGSTTVLAAFVNDQSGDYIPKSLDADEGFHVAAFQVRILT